MGWASKSNGELLGLAAAEFDVCLTVDRNLPTPSRSAWLRALRRDSPAEDVTQMRGLGLGPILRRQTIEFRAIIDDAVSVTV